MVNFKRQYKYNKKKDSQILNKNWWENNPMNYDWEKKK